MSPLSHAPHRLRWRLWVALATFAVVSHRAGGGEESLGGEGFGTGGAESEETTPPSASELLAEVLARLPHEPLRLLGSITVRRRHGIPENRFRFEMELRWGAPIPSARYRIMDALGADLEDLIVKPGGGGVPHCQYVSLQCASTQLPRLTESVQNTDLTWADLTLAFLWWQGGTVVRKGTALGRTCWVVEVPIPEPIRQGDGASGYTAMRLWIDAEYRLLLQAEGLDGNGRPVRRLWVRSLKKIEDRWMIKDIEVETLGRPRRTKLTVEQVEPLS